MSLDNSIRNCDMAQSEKQPPQGQWSTALFDCLEDRSNCLFTCFCPCMAFGRIAEIVDRGTTSCAVAGTIYHVLASVGCGWLYAGSYRTKLRGHFSLPAAPCHDLLVHSFCCVCSICQEYRELKNHGIDPSIGWQANVEKWNREGVKPPMVEPAMAR
ncbi:putative PLAC8 motif-containing protein [Rosa chinensis]|uniref:Putative PLAC8 motif-containing protein n=1 Tax=Rosa chinensis TaxID=74649 RepID=A0A2P6R1U6_ROSCH|nr:protein PLANT CADMIUM RESISTANCE 9 [Rosa chinensis]PRQ40401.1 putative PLAC8 motif-containing protein [Rosa chinensis]